MKIDQDKLEKLLPGRVAPSPDELRREGDVFFVGGNLPEQETLETLFESHYQRRATLFYLTFGGTEFPKAESLARTIKKNFNAHLVGRLDRPVSSHLIERAYAAGVDIVDVALPAGSANAAETLRRALEVFPRWGVASTLTAGEEPYDLTRKRIDRFLDLGVVPLVTLSPQAPRRPVKELVGIFAHLQAGWCARKAAIKPLLPLICLCAPYVGNRSRGGLLGFIDLIDGKRLLATSDLRRILRVKEVEESFSSSGL